MRVHTLLAAAAATTVLSLTAAAQTTVTFQNGVDGYTGAFDRTVAADLLFNALGSETPYYFLDGTGDGGNNDDDSQGLLRFENIIGNGPGQIPAGAYILDASLTLSTAPESFNGFSNSGGPYGVAQMLQPFDATSSTSYFGYGQNGPQVADGVIARPVSAFGNPDNNGNANGERVSTNVAPILQAWAGGDTNHGFNISTGPFGTNNGWAIATTSADVAERPALSVTFTTDDVQRATFQQGVNGYTGTSSTHIAQLPDGTTELFDADTVGFDFLDGDQDTSAGGSADRQLNIKFDDLFQSDGGLIPDNAQIVKAQLVLTTTSDESRAAEGAEPYVVAPLLVPFDDTLGFEDFGGDGPTQADGELGAIADTVVPGVIAGEAYFDITSIIAGLQAGDENFGLNIQGSELFPDITDDGWQIYFPGAADADLRPELIVDYTVIPEPASATVLLMGGLLGLRRRR